MSPHTLPFLFLYFLQALKLHFLVLPIPFAGFNLSHCQKPLQPVRLVQRDQLVNILHQIRPHILHDITKIFLRYIGKLMFQIAVYPIPVLLINPQTQLFFLSFQRSFLPYRPPRRKPQVFAGRSFLPLSAFLFILPSPTEDCHPFLQKRRQFCSPLAPGVEIRLIHFSLQLSPQPVFLAGFRIVLQLIRFRAAKFIAEKDFLLFGKLPENVFRDHLFQDIIRQIDLT